MSNKYFTRLNYTLSNEDSFFELSLLPESAKHIVSICGSGSRVLPLLAKMPNEVSIIDSSQLQLDLCALRIESVKRFSYDSFISFWGYKKISSSERKNLFSQLKISDADKEKWIQIFNENNWSEPIYYGKWEQAVQKLSRTLRILLGEKNIHRLFSFKKEEDYFLFLKKKFPWWRFNLFISILTQPFLMNWLLYKGHHAKFRNPDKKNVATFYIDFFSFILKQGVASQNFFLQLALNGKVDNSKGFPAEANKEVFEQIKLNVDKIKINYYHGDFFQIVSDLENSIDFISLSDVPSYFSDELEQNHLQLLYKNLSPSAVVCSRYYLNCLSNIDSKNYSNITAQYSELISKEKTPFYRFDIWKKDIVSGT